MGNDLTYNSIDELPVWNWYKCNQKEDYKFLLRVYDKDYKADLKPLYDAFHQEYLDLFGAGEEREKLMNLINQLIKYKAAYLQGQKHMSNFIKIAEFQLAQMGNKQTKKPQSIEKLCALVSKVQGYRVDPRTTTVVEFHEILNIIEDGNKTNKGK